MKNFKKGIFVLALAVLYALSGYSQSKSITQKADELFQQKKYIEAAEKYETAFKSIKSNRAEKNRVLFQMAECYRFMNYYDKAIRYYKRLVSNKYYTSEPKIYLYLAEMYRFSVVDNNIELADQYYDEYLKLVPGDEYGTERKSSLKLIAKMYRERTRHVIDSVPQWNTKYNDWMLNFFGNDTNTIVFSSSRINDDDARKDEWTGEAFSSIYYQTKDRKGNWMDLQLIDGEAGIINTQANESEASATADGNIVFFTRCAVIEHRENNCQVYVTVRVQPEQDKKGKKKSKKDENNEPEQEWSNPKLVYLGDTTYSHMHPCITPDGLTLYFSSDMPDGFGDYDLWMAKRASLNDSFGTPVNLGGKINTAGREVFPTLNQDSVLYFSSNGLPGIGGLDLFRAIPKGNSWEKVENLGVPINSSFDEFGIIYFPNTGADYNEHGYFTSNRYVPDPHNKNTEFKGKRLPDLQYDHFSFFLPPLLYSIEGTVRDEKSMQLMRGVKVRLVGSDGTEYEETTDKAGFYRFGKDKIKRNIIYKMYLSKVDYFSVEGSESTYGYNTDKELVHNFRMEPVPKQPVTLPEIRYDLAKWDLQEQYQDSLMDLYLILVNNPNLVIEIRSHTDCRPFIRLTNDTLSQRRAQSVVDYLISRGIEPERLVAKGYGERVPREMEKDMMVKGYLFKKGTVLECEYVKRLPQPQQEVAHQLNRRTDFVILRTDFVSKKLINNMASDVATVKETEDGKIIDLVNKPTEENEELEPSIIHDEAVVPVTMIHSTKGEVTAIVNGSAVTMLIDERFNEALAISWEEAMNFLYKRRINKEDFPERDNSFDPEGNILDKSIVILKSVQIGQNRLEKVEAVVLKNAPGNFVINRVGLNEFGKYEFNKQKARLTFIDD
ncbi:MAG: OmpA family protein [Bacteroidales bacterium]|nr:OmpA family protein [Bacteroidales bacterium]